ncbi:MAG: GNAT family N-acetyltransferase [Candidatus Nitrosotenuis sp.]
MKNKTIVLPTKIILKNVNVSDHKFLYELLGERRPIENISHKKMPTYMEHVKFVNSKPYSKWYVIHYKNQKIGTIYLTKQNEIGIHIKKDYQRHGLGKYAMKLLIKKNPRNRYLANINPKNKKSIEFFTKQGFKLIQYTYEMIPGKF